MKKLVLIIFLLVYMILPQKIMALENDSYLSWQIDKNIYAHRMQEGIEQIDIYTMLIVNNEVVYCVEPGTPLPKDKIYNSTNMNVLNLNDNLLKYITLVGYYGYNYENHGYKEYYMASQELIWEALGTDVWWTTADYSNVIDIEGYKNEILNLVNNYEIAPYFNFKDNYVIGSEIVINDDNNVLSNYYSLNDNVIINGNNLTLKIEDEKKEFTLKRKNSDNMTTFYYKDGYQTTALFKSGYPFDNYYTVNGIYKDIILEKKDYDTKESTSISSDTTLSGAIYGLYDDNNNVLIKEEETNDKGVVIFHDISYGNYYIKEIKPSLGYNLDNQKYEVKVNEEPLDVIISYEKIIKNNINIIKFLKDGDDFTLEPNIEFELYNSYNNLYDTYITDDNGCIIITLPYGKYILKQKTKLHGITMAEDTNIEVIDDNKTSNIVLINEKLPKTGKSFNCSLFFIFEIIMFFVFKYDKKNI